MWHQVRVDLGPPPRETLENVPVDSRGAERWRAEGGGALAHQMDSVTLRLEAYLPASEFH